MDKVLAKGTYLSMCYCFDKSHNSQLGQSSPLYLALTPKEYQSILHQRCTLMHTNSNLFINQLIMGTLLLLSLSFFQCFSASRILAYLKQPSV